MAQEIHFEIFKRAGSKGGWTLIDVSNARERAIEIAETLMKEGGATGVKVVKETYSTDTGDFLTLKIFEDGHNQVKTKPEAEDVPHALPCFKPDDLYSYHARATMARLLCDYLARHKLTITEMIHRADALEKFEATGTLYQHAIQKIAVAQAASTSAPVQQIVKLLNDLVTKAIHRVYRDSRRLYFPDVSPGKFAALTVKLAAQPDGLYVLNGAIARHLANAASWDEKLTRLLALIKESQSVPEGHGRALLLSACDSLVTEILNGAAALHELNKGAENLGHALLRLAELFLGKPMDATAGTSLAILGEHFAKDELEHARAAIANRILAELKSVKSLCPDSLIDELKMLKRIANRLVLGQGKFLSHEDLIAAFTLRSKRLVTHESIGAHLNEVHGVDEKLERLLLIEENIIGAENKRYLASFVTSLLNSPAFETHFLFAKTPIVARLTRLAELQARATRSNFHETQRQEIADALDKMACEVESRAKLLETVETRATGPVDKASAVLLLITSGALTEGRLSAKARDIVIGHLSQPGFLSSYMAQALQSNGKDIPTRETAMNDLMQSLEKAGITPDTGLKTIAA